MSGLHDYGTGFAETELMIETITLFNEWDGENDLTFEPVLTRLATFPETELLKLKTVLSALDLLIQKSLAER